MIHIKDFGDTTQHQFPEDLKRIQSILLKYNYYASLSECEVIWKRYSDSMDAGWMTLPEEDEILWSCISPYL